MGVMFCLNGHYFDDGEPIYISRRAYMIAQRRKARLPPKPAPFCPDCGANVISACPGENCKAPLRLGSDSEKAPDYCTGCGDPFPWKIAADIAASVVVEEPAEEGERTVIKPAGPLTRFMRRAKSFAADNGPTLAREAAKIAVDEGTKKLMGG